MYCISPCPSWFCHIRKFPLTLNTHHTSLLWSSVCSCDWKYCVSLWCHRGFSDTTYGKCQYTFVLCYRVSQWISKFKLVLTPPHLNFLFKPGFHNWSPIQGRSWPIDKLSLYICTDSQGYSGCLINSLQMREDMNNSGNMCKRKLQGKLRIWYISMIQFIQCFLCLPAHVVLPYQDIHTSNATGNSAVTNCLFSWSVFLCFFILS